MKKAFIMAALVAIAVLVAAPAFAQFTTAEMADDSTVAATFNDMHAAVQSLKGRLFVDGVYTQAAFGKAARDFALAKFTAERKVAEAAVGHSIAAYDLQVARMAKPTAAERKLQAEQFVSALMGTMTSLEQIRNGGANTARLDSLEARIRGLEAVVAEHTTAIKDGRDLTVSVANAAGRATDEKADKKVRRTASVWLAGVR